MVLGLFMHYKKNSGSNTYYLEVVFWTRKINLSERNILIIKNTVKIMILSRDTVPLPLEFLGLPIFYHRDTTVHHGLPTMVYQRKTVVDGVGRLCHDDFMMTRKR